MKLDFETVLGSSPNPYVLLDPDLIMVWMNDAYLAATMRERADLVGQNMFERFPSDEASESHRLLQSSFDRVRRTRETDEIALIRYDIENSEGGTDARYWSATHTPICEDGELRFILQHTVDVTELQQLRQVREEMSVMRRANAVQKRNSSLREETRKLLDFFEQAPGFIAVLLGPDHSFGMANEAYRELVGRDDLVGHEVSEVLPEIADQGFVAILDQVFTTGEAYFGRREQIVLEPGGAQDTITRYLNFVFQPMLDDDGSVRGIIMQGHDVTEEIEAQERQTLLVNELNHRVKNTLAIVQGLSTQSFRGPQSCEERAVFEGRLHALAAAHNLLTEGNWGAAGVQEIICKSAEATVGEAMRRVHTSGEKIHLPPQTAVSLAMVIHELCTNALKYGALSDESGRVDVAWETRADAGREFRIEWKESGGPTVATPEHAGFGSRLISRGISDRPGSGVDTRYEADGFRCTLVAMLEQ